MTAAGEVPGEVTVLDAGQGGGSGEITLRWEAVADATGYLVYRSAAPGGPFAQSAEVDGATGEATGAGVFVWSPAPGSFEYIEVTGDGPVYFRVTAFNADGEGPPSVVVCGGADGIC